MPKMEPSFEVKIQTLFASNLVCLILDKARQNENKNNNWDHTLKRKQKKRFSLNEKAG